MRAVAGLLPLAGLCTATLAASVPVPVPVLVRCPATVRFTPGLVLRDGSAEQAGLGPDLPARLAADAAGFLRPTPAHPAHPAYPGAVVLVARHAVVAARIAVGDAVRYGPVAGGFAELPPARRVPMRTGTRFDIASLTKLFTTVVALREVERGTVALDAPVARYLPEFAAGGKGAVTVRELLTHTAGLVVDLDLTRYPDRAAALDAVLRAPPAPGTRPGAQYQYSDLDMISLGAVAERVTGRRLDELVGTEITGPLGLAGTGYAPAVSTRDSAAATEYRPGYGLLRGVAHDEKVAPLGGVAGHAGLFSTADDLAVFAQLLLDGGSYGGHRILAPATVRAMLANANARFPGQAHGFGVDLDQPWYMGALASPVTFGHTGFTGTSLVADPGTGTILVLLTNEVQPDRSWTTLTGYRNVPRRTLADDVAAALPAGTCRAWRPVPA